MYAILDAGGPFRTSHWFPVKSAAYASSYTSLTGQDLDICSMYKTLEGVLGLQGPVT